MRSSKQNQVSIHQGTRVQRRSLRSLISELLGRQISKDELLLIVERGREIGQNEPWLKDMCTGGLRAHISSAAIDFRRQEMMSESFSQTFQRTERRSYGTSGLSWDEIDIKYDRKQRYRTKPNRFARRTLGAFRRGRKEARSMKGDLS